MSNKETLFISEYLKDEDFKEWLTSFYWGIGYSRYAQFNGNFVIGCDNLGDTQEHLANLDDCDAIALDAGSKLSDMIKNDMCYIASDDNPIEAMNKLVFKLCQRYEEINE